MADRRSARQRRTADETRALVLDAAVAWIEENGFASLKVVDIARSSGVSDVMIIRLFSDRAGLLTAALVELWKRYMSAPLDQAKQLISALPEHTITPQFLIDLSVRPNDEVVRRQRWARLQVLAASPENPELVDLIKAAQAQINQDHEELIAEIQRRMPGRHAATPRMMRMLNQNVMFGFVLEDLAENPITDDELNEFLLEFYRRMVDPEVE